jgi:uncharacterized protein (DUF433 family)
MVFLIAEILRMIRESICKEPPLSTATLYPHLAIDADGTARISDTRYKVLHLAAEHHYYGWSAEELLRQHPDLRPEEVYAALTYFYDHRDELVERMSEMAGRAAATRPAQPVSREELLQRKNRQAN